MALEIASVSIHQQKWKDNVLPPIPGKPGIIGFIGIAVIESVVKDNTSGMTHEQLQLEYPVLALAQGVRMAGRGFCLG